MTVNPCRLCGETKELRESHILPRFVFRWMMETSATGYLRFRQQPNLRVQDGLKVHLLCENCEQRFNRWETDFANRVFQPLAQGDAARASYGSWLLLFCTSVSWRVLVYHMDTTQLRSVAAALLPSVELAELTWRKFLLGSGQRLQGYEQHILPMPRGAVESYTYTDMPTNINRYLFRSSEMTVASNDRDAFTYAKLGPFIILGFIAMPRPKQWVGTRVNTHGGILGPRNYVLPEPFDKFIFERAGLAARLQEQISDKQTAKIAETYRGNMDRVALSDSMRAMHQDVELFGRKAFKRK